MTRRTFTIIFILGIALRIFWIQIPLWYDENFTLILARLPFSQMMQAVYGDVHPPLWYLIEWTLYHLVPTLPAWFIRVPACLFSIVALVLFTKVMDQLQISPNVKALAFVLMTILPFQLWYAQEGRMYAMLEFFVLLALSAALGRNYILLFIGSLGMLYTQNYGAFYMAAIALVIIARENLVLGLFNNFKRYNLAMVAMVSAGILWLPWYFVVKQQMANIAGNYWIMDTSVGSVLIILYKIFLSAAMPSELFFASYTVIFAVLIIGIIAIWKSSHPARLTIAIMATVPLLLAWIISLVWQPVLLFRPLIGISPFLYLVACWFMEPKENNNEIYN